jgi:hypothetical protein
MRFFLPVDNSSSENHSFFSGLDDFRAVFLIRDSAEEFALQSVGSR